MTSVFTRIIKREIPAFVIYEDGDYIAFLDAFPLVKGHTLIVPKKEVDNLFELDDKTYLGLMKLTKKIALAIEKSHSCNRIAMSVIGLEVPHAHIHLMPIDRESDTNFSNPKLSFSKEEFEQIQRDIQNNLS